jgi:hypothetical protein
MRLIGCGDSWCWGAELVDPIEEPVPIMNLPGGGFERQLKQINIDYRLKHRYLNLFADKIGATEIVDLSKPSLSNDAIVRRLIEFLANEGYTTGRDTSDLFITIGWSSPERREFYYKERWGSDNWMEFGPWSMEQDHGNPDVDKFMRLYFDNFWNEGEFLHRWIQQVWQTELMLKSLNIKYVMHQAFYHHHTQMINQWDDKKYKEKFTTITKADKLLWDSIDNVKFIHKDHPEVGTMHHYMLSQAKDVFEVFHPNHKGHAIWADYMHKYCVENNLL